MIELGYANISSKNIFMFYVLWLNITNFEHIRNYTSILKNSSSNYMVQSAIWD